MKNLPYDRAQRVADEVHRIIATICYNELSDPRLAGLAITNVKMTKDLQIARVYYYMHDADEDRRHKAKMGLESASGFFKRAIGEEMELRFMPTLEYFYDETIDLEEKIESLKKRGKNEDL